MIYGHLGFIRCSERLPFVANSKSNSEDDDDDDDDNDDDKKNVYIGIRNKFTGKRSDQLHIRLVLLPLTTNDDITADKKVSMSYKTYL